MGIETIAAALGEARDAIEEIVEPYLMQQGFVQRTPRGRMLTGAAYRHLGLTAPPASPPPRPACFARTTAMNELKGLGSFDGKTHILPISVYYEDTDLSGVVYHANYLRYHGARAHRILPPGGHLQAGGPGERRTDRLGASAIRGRITIARRAWTT